MARKRKTPTLANAPVLYSLTACQAEWLHRARDTHGGTYVSLVAGREPHELVEAGAAVFREVRQIGGTRGKGDPRPCEWIDRYLVPTEHGLDLLRTTTK